MPFGGHQQVSGVKWIRKTPYIHLLPMRLYQYVLRKSGESQSGIDKFTDIKKTGISIERFQRAVKAAEYIFDKKTTYLFNPNYEVKFKLKPRKKIPLIGDIPYIRNFVTTCMYAIISKKHSIHILDIRDLTSIFIISQRCNNLSKKAEVNKLSCNTLTHRLEYLLEVMMIWISYLISF